MILLRRWLDKRFDGGEDGHSANEEEWQREEHEQGVEPRDGSGNHGIVGICGIDQAGYFLSFRHVGDDFPHGADADVAAHAGAEEVVAVAGVMCSVDVVFIMDIDAIRRTAFGAAAAVEMA